MRTVREVESRSTRRGSRRYPTASTRSRCACSTRISIPAHELVGGAKRWRRGGSTSSCSHEVSPEFREYERIVTTVAERDAPPDLPAVPPAHRGAGRRRARDDVGGRAGAGVGRGRAAGRAAAERAGRRSARRGDGRRGRAGSPTRSRSTWAARAPTCAWSAAARPSRRRCTTSPGSRCAYPSLDILTIGAGGGSIARLDPGGALVVGPRERGRGARAGVLRARRHRADGHRRRPRARPHPGRDGVPGARGARRRRGARARSTDAGLTAEGIVQVVDANMERAVRVVTVERGVDAARSRTRRVRRRGAVARVRGRRRARDARRCWCRRGRGSSRRVGPRVGAAAAGARALVARPGRPRRPRRARGPSSAREVAGARGLRGRRGRGRDVRRLPLRGPEPRADRRRGRRTSRPSTRAATATPATGHARSRSSRCGPGRAARRRSTRPSCPAWPRARVVGPVGRDRARLHGLGARRLDRRADPTAPGSCGAP